MCVFQNITPVMCEKIGVFLLPNLQPELQRIDGSTEKSCGVSLCVVDAYHCLIVHVGIVKCALILRFLDWPWLGPWLSCLVLHAQMFISDV